MQTPNDPYSGYGMQTISGPKRNPLNSYRGAKTLTFLTLVLLLLAILTDGTGALIGIGAMKVLHDIREGNFADDAEMMAVSEACDSRVTTIAWAQVAVALASGLAFMFWTYRIVKNADCLHVSSLPRGPGWAVGWYFIPIMNLFMPCVALLEAHKASQRPDAPSEANNSALIIVWWCIHIIGVISSRVSTQMAVHSGREETTIDFAIAFNAVNLFNDVLMVVLNVLTVWIVMSFAKYQQMAYANAVGRLQPPDPVSPPAFSNQDRFPPSEFQTFGS